MPHSAPCPVYRCQRTHGDGTLTSDWTGSRRQYHESGKLFTHCRRPGVCNNHRAPSTQLPPLAVSPSKPTVLSNYAFGHDFTTTESVGSQKVKACRARPWCELSDSMVGINQRANQLHNSPEGTGHPGDPLRRCVREETRASAGPTHRTRRNTMERHHGRTTENSKPVRSLGLRQAAWPALERMKHYESSEKPLSSPRQFPVRLRKQ